MTENPYWRGYFPSYQEDISRIILEIGSGWGEWICKRIQAGTDNELFVATEVLRHRANQIAQHALSQKISPQRLRVVIGDTTEWLQNTPPHSFSEVYCHYPEPWPKRRHAKNRLTSPRSLAVLLRRIAPGGTFHLVTDMDTLGMELRDRVELINRSFGPLLSVVFAGPRSPEAPRTQFETRAISGGFIPFEVHLRCLSHPTWSHLSDKRFIHACEELFSERRRLTVGQRL